MDIHIQQNNFILHVEDLKRIYAWKHKFYTTTRILISPLEHIFQLLRRI
jgi:hypothetical protein